jgi:hypothetical protein
MGDFVFRWVGAGVCVAGGLSVFLYLVLVCVRLAFKHINILKNSWDMFQTIRREKHNLRRGA